MGLSSEEALCDATAFHHGNSCGEDVAHDSYTCVVRYCVGHNAVGVVRHCIGANAVGEASVWSDSWSYHRTLTVPAVRMFDRIPVKCGMSSSQWYQSLYHKRLPRRLQSNAEGIGCWHDNGIVRTVSSGREEQ
ncbi:hypothetical protein E2C01_051223 [Portunus trituberculatus]|uniref:Uncharacterized protein n=1 Tax=Portunus trituberculatus TaxID=210409 RepID=A0A5B7GIK7_PORTR|nr:hypothetical protein [Portunus trituberculatus]